MSEADPLMSKSAAVDDHAAYVIWLNAELKKGLDSGISERTVQQIIADHRQKREAA
jgi:hypothetical protein